jgi:adenosine deaminase
MRAATLAELAAQQGLSVPPDLPFHAGMGLAAALSRFAFTLACLQQPLAVERVAREIAEDAAREGVTTLELRFAPQLHGGGTIEEVVDAALRGLGGRAGLILCALYGEAPEVAEQLVDVAIPRPGVVGIDLAGGPAPGHRFGMRDYAPAFRRAAAAGIGRTVHAAEGRPPEEIRVAIEQLQAQRIGHGTTLLDDESVVALVLERGVTIEACPTSNWQVGAIANVGDHPIRRWLERGVKVCVNTDNTLLSAVSAPEELRRVQAATGMSDTEVARVVAYGHAGAFRR